MAGLMRDGARASERKPIVRQQIRDCARRRWCYVLQADQLADLRARYGERVDAVEEPDGTAPSTFFSINPVTTGASGG
jgi:hypothetical protein